MTRHDRVLMVLPLESAVGSDAQLALLELGALMLACERAALSDVLQFEPTVLLSTLSDALRLGQAAFEAHIDTLDNPLRLAVVTGEPGGSLAVTRRSIEARWGAHCLDVYALTEFGPIGWSCRQRPDGLHLDDTQLAFEVVDPDTGMRIAEGELGELVVTTPADWGTPLECFHSGDLVRLSSGECACGSRAPWAEGGVIGRVEDRLSVRGQLLLPSTIEQVVRRHPAVVDFRLKAYPSRGSGDVAILLETTPIIASEGDLARVAAEVSEDVRRSLGLRLHCDVVPPGSSQVDQDPGRRARRLSRQES